MSNHYLIAVLFQLCVWSECPAQAFLAIFLAIFHSRIPAMFCEVFRSIFYDIEHPMTGTTETEIFFQSKKGPHWAPFIVQAPASAPQVQVCALHFERGLDRVAGNPAYYGHPGRVPCHACDESAGEHLSHHQWALRARSIFSGRRGREEGHLNGLFTFPIRPRRPAEHKPKCAPEECGGQGVV